MRDKRIGEVLCRMGVIASHDISRILKHQRRTRQKFGQIAIRWGLATHEQVWEAWARQLAERDGVELEAVGNDTAALELIPLSTARELGIVPLRLWGRHLVVAAPSELSAELMDQLCGQTGCTIHVCISDTHSIHDRLKRLTTLSAA
jgi:hypothetical protein